MKLIKFNILFLPLLALALGAVAYTARQLLRENARKQIIENARIMMETASSSRTYTSIAEPIGSGIPQVEGAEGGLS